MKILTRQELEDLRKECEKGGKYISPETVLNLLATLDNEMKIVTRLFTDKAEAYSRGWSDCMTIIGSKYKQKETQ